MELELSRHNWSALEGPRGLTHLLPAAIRELHLATDRAVAVAAAERIDNIVSDNGLLSQVSVPLASCLVHCVSSCAGPALAPALGLLSDISGGSVSDVEPDAYGPVTWEDCMAEIVTGLPAYVEILEGGQDIEASRYCVDLILMCGLFDPRFHNRAIFYLQSALAMESLAVHHGVILDSLAELRDGDG